MKKLIPFLLLSLATSTCMAQPLSNFIAVKTALLRGQSIHIIVDFNKCVSNNRNKPQAQKIGIFTPSAFSLDDQHISTSLTHFTLNNPFFRGKPVYEFVRYSINNDNSVSLTDQVLDAASFKPMSDTFSAICQMEDGVTIYT